MKKENTKPNIIYQKNKKLGVVYAYEDHPYWNPEKKQSRSNRKCIGKVDPKTGEIIPTRGRKTDSLHNVKLKGGSIMSKETTIDVSSILNQLDQKIARGIREGGYTLTDVSLLVSGAVSEVQKKIMLDVSEIIEREKIDNSSGVCEECGNAVKKTTNETNQ